MSGYIETANTLFNKINDYYRFKLQHGEILLEAEVKGYVSQLLSKTDEGYKLIDYLDRDFANKLKETIKSHNHIFPELDSYIPARDLFKFFGLKTGLGLKFTDALGNKVSFTGSFTTKTAPEINKNLKKFLASDSFKQATTDPKIIEAFQKIPHILEDALKYSNDIKRTTDTEGLWKKYENNDFPVVVLSGFKDPAHAVVFILTADRIYECNRGFGRNKKDYGIVEYSFNSGKIDKALFTELYDIQQKSFKEYKNFKAKLSPKAFNKIKDQEGAHCSFTSLDAALPTIPMILAEKSFGEVKPVYTAYSRFSKESYVDIITDQFNLKAPDNTIAQARALDALTELYCIKLRKPHGRERAETKKIENILKIHGKKDLALHKALELSVIRVADGGAINYAPNLLKAYVDFEDSDIKQALGKLDDVNKIKHALIRGDEETILELIASDKDSYNEDLYKEFKQNSECDLLKYSVAFNMKELFAKVLNRNNLFYYNLHLKNNEYNKHIFELAQMRNPDCISDLLKFCYGQDLILLMGLPSYVITSKTKIIVLNSIFKGDKYFFSSIMKDLKKSFLKLMKQDNYDIPVNLLSPEAKKTIGEWLVFEINYGVEEIDKNKLISFAITHDLIKGTIAENFGDNLGEDVFAEIYDFHTMIGNTILVFNLIKDAYLYSYKAFTKLIEKIIEQPAVFGFIFKEINESEPLTVEIKKAMLNLLPLESLAEVVEYDVIMDFVLRNKLLDNPKFKDLIKLSPDSLTKGLHAAIIKASGRDFNELIEQILKVVEEHKLLAFSLDKALFKATENNKLEIVTIILEGYKKLVTPEGIEKALEKSKEVEECNGQVFATDADIINLLELSQKEMSNIFPQDAFVETLGDGEIF